MKVLEEKQDKTENIKRNKFGVVNEFGAVISRLLFLNVDIKERKKLFLLLQIKCLYQHQISSGSWEEQLWKFSLVDGVDEQCRY